MDQDIDVITQKVLEQSKAFTFQTFAVRAKRNQKIFPLNQLEIERHVGAVVNESVSARVDLERPEVTFRVYIVDKDAFVGYERYEGSGGLPVGVSGRVLVLLSGGIDSPVAANQLQKRGSPVDFIHFHNAPYTSEASKEKAVNLARMIAQKQEGGELYLVPFTDIQKEIVKHTDQQYRVLLYRRFMLKMAEDFAKEMNILVLATGDNIGQVASQTIENISAVQSAVSLPILRPLLTWDKQEIIDVARRIGTFEESSLPHEDCCSYFMPRQPATHASVAMLDTQEKMLDLQAIWENTLDNIEHITL